MILEFPQAPDVQTMDAPALTAYLEQLRERLLHELDGVDAIRLS